MSVFISSLVIEHIDVPAIYSTPVVLTLRHLFAIVSNHNTNQATQNQQSVKLPVGHPTLRLTQGQVNLLSV